MPTEDTDSIEDSWKVTRPGRNTDYTESSAEPDKISEDEDPVSVTTLLPIEPYERSVI